MRYENFEYLYPPRPERAVPKNFLPQYEQLGFIAQVKKNGTCNLIAVSPQRKLVCMNRHKEDHKLWSPTPASSAAFQVLPGKGWYVFVAELMHSKVPGLRDINYVHDILVCDGEHLVGKSFVERQGLLQELFDTHKRDVTPSHYVVNASTWVARNHSTGFQKLFDGLSDVQDEGLVLKKATAALKIGLRASTNADWQVKCRKPHKNYVF